MKIDIMDAATGATVLYALMGGAVQSPEHMRRAMDTLTQITSAARATNVKVFDRGNNKHQFEFQCTRAYNSIALAEIALLGHPMDLPNGTFKFTPEQGATAYYLHDASFENVSGAQDGICIRWHYAITGGRLDLNPT